MATLTISQTIKAMELTLMSFREEGGCQEREISSEILWNKILSCDITVVEEDKTLDDAPAEEVKIPKKRGRRPKKVVEEEKTTDGEAEEDKKPVKPRAPKELIDFSSYGDLESLDWKKFVSNEGNSNKFWRATIQEQESEGKQVFKVLVHYGKIDSKGTYVQKTFESDDSSNEYLEKEVKSKTKKGYVSMNVE